MIVCEERAYLGRMLYLGMIFYSSKIVILTLSFSYIASTALPQLILEKQESISMQDEIVWVQLCIQFNLWTSNLIEIPFCCRRKRARRGQLRFRRAPSCYLKRSKYAACHSLISRNTRLQSFPDIHPSNCKEKVQKEVPMFKDWYFAAGSQTERAHGPCIVAALCIYPLCKCSANQGN